MLVNRERKIEFWNAMACACSASRTSLRWTSPSTKFRFPVLHLKSGLIRRHRTVLERQQPTVARAQFLGARLNSVADIHFSVIPREDKSNSVLIIIEPDGGGAVRKKKKTNRKRK